LDDDNNYEPSLLYEGRKEIPLPDGLL